MNNNNDNQPTSQAGQSARINPEQLAQALDQFTGTVNYYRHWSGLILYTDGVQYLAEKASCYWLLDIIASYQRDLAKHSDERLHEMQFWTLTVRADESAELVCIADKGVPPAITEPIEWTDFPLPVISLWVADGGNVMVAYLPSEH